MLKFPFALSFSLSFSFTLFAQPGCLSLSIFVLLQTINLRANFPPQRDSPLTFRPSNADSLRVPIGSRTKRQSDAPKTIERREESLFSASARLFSARFAHARVQLILALREPRLHGRAVLSRRGRGVAAIETTDSAECVHALAGAYI